MNSLPTITRSLLACLLLSAQCGYGDSLREASELLAVTHTESQFDSLAEQQARSIVATYASILDRALEVSLPPELQSEIVACYSEALPPGDIELFKDTIAMADHIAQLSGEFIYNNSSGCVERDAQLIHEFLRAHPGVVDIEQFDFAW